MATRDEKWFEHQIHEDESGEDKEFVFALFAKEEPYDTMKFEFPNVPEIAIQSQTESPTSTGLALWLGSERLCTFLADHKELVSGKEVIELGAGVGLCGIISNHLSAKSVVLTDGDSSVMENLRRNIDDNTMPENKKSISCRQLIWGKGLDTFEKFDVILAADCVYMNKSLGPLFKTIDHILKHDGLLIYCNLCASQAPLETVLEKASGIGLVWTQPEESIYVFRRRGVEEYLIAPQKRCHDKRKGEKGEPNSHNPVMMNMMQITERENAISSNFRRSCLVNKVKL